MGVVLLVLLAAAVIVYADRDEDDDGEGQACRPLQISRWAKDRGMTEEFVRYGDDTGRADDWTGGDGNHSVRLPDGRTLWLASDPYLDTVKRPPNQQGQLYPWRDTSLGRTPSWVRNAAMVMSADGRLERTILGQGPGGTPTPLFPDPSAPVTQWRWPVQAVVEPERPGADKKVVRVLLWKRQQAQAPWIYGVPLGTEVATLSLPDLRVQSVEQVSDQSGVKNPDKRVLYGAGSVTHGGHTYVFGGSDGRNAQAEKGTSSAYVARVPAGRLADRGAWRYWDGDAWRTDPAKAAPVLGDRGKRGVGSAFSVVRQDGTWVLFTMDAGDGGRKGLSHITSYWSCSATGPWHGPTRSIEAPLPRDTAPRDGAAVYNPQVHPELSKGGRLLLSYDVNWLDASASAVSTNVNRNVALYRPAFLRLRLGPAPDPG